MKTLLYTKKFNEKIKEPVDIILSPEFYWIKKIDIPLKSLKEARKISKTLFDLKGEFIYDAFKLKNTFFAVAIPKKLNLKIDKKYIKSIRIAQIEFFDFDCIKVDEDYYLKKIDDLIFYLPTPSQNCTLLEDVLKNIKLSNKTFLLNQINKELIITALVVFILINASLIIKTYSNYQEINKIEKTTKEILEKSNLPSTSFELISILNSLKQEIKKEEKIKKDLEFFSNTPLKKGEFYERLLFDGKNYSILVHTQKNLDDYFKKHFKIISSTFNKNTYKATLK